MAVLHGARLAAALRPAVGVGSDQPDPGDADLVEWFGLSCVLDLVASRPDRRRTGPAGGFDVVGVDLDPAMLASARLALSTRSVDTLWDLALICRLLISGLAQSARLPSTERR